jgi:hypothetical protein
VHFRLFVTGTGRELLGNCSYLFTRPVIMSVHASINFLDFIGTILGFIKYNLEDIYLLCNTYKVRSLFLCGKSSIPMSLVIGGKH